MLSSYNFWIGVAALAVSAWFALTVPFTTFSMIVWFATVVAGVLSIVMAFLYEK